jgi:hypothetical protein
MLKPFLFVGVGGSGGKTLRTLKADLQRRLLEAGDEGPWPSCWQLLHIDVPTDADGVEPDLPGQLDDKDYRGLVSPGVTYQIIDDGLISAGHADEAVLRNLIGWRPDPVKVHVPINKGAGQFRALGRAVVMANLASVAEGIAAATERLHGTSVSADLSRVSRAFNVPVSSVPQPEAVVISSLAGGSGSGAFLDICDMLRAVGGPGYADDAYGVLYAPDVFDHLPPDSRRGVYANALGALSELMAAFWDMEPRDEDYALFQKKGKRNVGAPGRRGPRFPFIVGIRNDQVGFPSQNDVYWAMGKALAAWTVSEHLQNAIAAYAVGNWGLSSMLPDATGLKDEHQQQPLCAIGFARVALGRDNFAEYAAERLARRAVDRILRQHLADRPPEADPNHEVAVNDAANGVFAAFLDASGLDERGEQRNQILDALRPVDRSKRLAELAGQLRATLVGGRVQSVPASQWRAEAIDLLVEQRGRFADEEATQRNDRAREWVKEIADRLTFLVSSAVASNGAPVTEKLLERLRAEVEFVLTELPDEQARYARWADDIDVSVSSAITPSSEAWAPGNPLLAQGLEKGLDCYEFLAEADLRGFATTLVRDLLHNFIDPLLTAVRAGRRLLVVEEQGTSTDPSQVARWPEHDLVPKRFQPAGNEFFLEPVERYPDLFRSLVTRSASSEDPGGAEVEYVRHVIVGSRPADPNSQGLVRAHTSWVPALPELQTSFGTATSAQFKLEVAPRELLLRARHLVNDHDTVMGAVIGESLREHLDQERVDPAELAQRRARFQDAFTQALATSKPLVNINPQALSRIHGQSSADVTYLFTEIPFTDGTVGYETVRSILESQGKWKDDVAGAFGEGNQARIDVFSMLTSAYSPLVFESLIGPIASEWAAGGGGDGFWRWRRSRPLSTFVPTSGGVRLAMVRGWFTARLLGQLHFEAGDRASMGIWVPHSSSMRPFPKPLLGPGVHQDWERLPAVLESLPVAMVRYAQLGPRGDDDLRPYQRLRELGTDPRGPEFDYDSVSPVLETWIRRGEVPVGGPPATTDLAGPVGDDIDDAVARRDRCLATIRDWRHRYAELVTEPVTVNDFFSTPRVTELSADILEALDDLDRATSRLTVEVPGVW